MSKEVKINTDIKECGEINNMDTEKNTESNADINKILEEMKSLKEDLQNQRNELAKEKEEFAKLKESNTPSSGMTEEEVKKLLEEQRSIFNISKKDLEKISIEETKSTKEILDSEPKVRIKIPIDPLNEKDIVVPVQINGYPYTINRGETVNVPLSVANLLESAKYI